MRRNRVQAASVRRKASESFTGKKLINNVDINEGLKKRIKIPWIKISIGEDLLRKIVFSPIFLRQKDYYSILIWVSIVKIQQGQKFFALMTVSHYKRNHASNNTTRLSLTQIYMSE